MRDDLRQALRALARSPLYSGVAILTLALGIGVTTAAFTVVGSVLLKPLPYAKPDQLVNVYSTNRASEAAREGAVPSYPAFEEMRQKADVFSGFAYITGDGATFRRPGGSESLLIAMVTDDFFPLLEARPALGRLLTPEDNRPDAPPVAVLSHRMWTDDFGADPRVVGKTIDLTFNHFTIVGVLDAGQAYPDWVPGVRANIYTPIASAPYMRDKLSRRTNHADARTIARLKSGVTREQAERELRTLAASIAVAYPATDSALPSALVRPLRDQVVGSIGPAFAVLSVAVALVLLLACADVANLALVRATSREREIAVRAALGAGRLRIARVLLAESGLLAIAGGVLGIALAFAGVRAFVAAPATIPRLDEIGVDWRALVVALLATTLATVLCALAPLVAVGRGDLVPALKAGSRGAGAARRSMRLRGAIVTAQVAFSVVLITGAGLLIKSFALLRAVNPGFDTEHVLGFHLSTPKGKFNDEAAVLALLHRVSDALAMPGVASVSFTNHVPLNTGGTYTQSGPDGRDPASDTLGAVYEIAYPRYFSTIGIPIIQGREFTEADITAGNVPSIVSAFAAKRYWPNGDPIGRELTVLNAAHGDPGFGHQIRTTVVGVAGDVKKFNLNEDPYPMVYVPLGVGGYGVGDVVVRATSSPAALMGAVRRAAAAIDPDIAIRDLSTTDKWLEANIARQAFIMTLLTIFSGVALVLAALGLYGVIAYSVTQRTSELGIRMALGARTSDVVALVARSASVLVVSGLALGACGAFVLGRAMQSLLYGVRSGDPATFVSVAGILLTVGALASYLPARRAARVDPVVALRSE
ncbi:MAG TPA: ABC transporter permease [Gemmatimonadaceae bacterium]|nr:ABC transporter permease [Gemmatimonadaceae bacterium]